MIVTFVSVRHIGYVPQKETPIMLQSVREAIPGAHIVMLTDQWTDEVPGVDEVIRRDREVGVSMFRLEHWAAMPYREWVTLDTDLVVRAPLEDVFEKPFDVALTRRAVDLRIHDMPPQSYNIGVMFSRCPEFWQEALRYARSLEWRWREVMMIDQLAVCATAPKFDVLDLTTAEFNRKPHFPGDPCDGSRVVHFAGPERKQWMLAAYGSRLKGTG